MTNDLKFSSHCYFKSPLVRARAQFLHPTMVIVLNTMADYCQAQGMPFWVTETVTTDGEDARLKRVSDTHRTARAFDLSIYSWSENAITRFIDQFEIRFQSIAAIGVKTKLPRLIVRHDTGFGDHLHVQLKRAYAINDPLKVLSA